MTLEQFELQKYKEAYEDDPLFKIKPLPLGKTNSSQIEVKKQLVDWNGWAPGAAVLAKKENGDCVYLGDDYRCQIYENRPIACREYVCVGDVRVKDKDMERRSEGRCVT